jgi:hypothetical protein
MQIAQCRGRVAQRVVGNAQPLEPRHAQTLRGAEPNPGPIQTMRVVGVCERRSAQLIGLDLSANRQILPDVSAGDRISG